MISIQIKFTTCLQFSLDMSIKPNAETGVSVLEEGDEKDGYMVGEVNHAAEELQRAAFTALNNAEIVGISENEDLFIAVVDPCAEITIIRIT